MRRLAYRARCPAWDEFQQGAYSGQRSLEEIAKAGRALLVFLEREEGKEFLPDELFVKTALLAEDDPFDVDPVLRPAGEGLEDDQVFTTAGQQRNAFSHVEGRRARHRAFLEGIAPRATSSGIPFALSSKRTRWRSAKSRASGMRGRKVDTK